MAGGTAALLRFKRILGTPSMPFRRIRLIEYGSLPTIVSVYMTTSITNDTYKQKERAASR